MGYSLKVVNAAIAPLELKYAVQWEGLPFDSRADKPMSNEDREIAKLRKEIVDEAVAAARKEVEREDDEWAKDSSEGVDGEDGLKGGT